MSRTRNEDPNRRLTKADRREQARQDREQLQRRLSKKRRTRLWTILGAILVAGLVVAGIVIQPFAGVTPQDLIDQASAASTTAGCTAVKTTDPYDPQDQDRAHIGDVVRSAPPLSTYPTIPPASGPHNPVPLPAGVYDTPPPIDQVIHSMEHGVSVIWYAPSATGEALTELKDFYSQKISQQDVRQDRVIVAPYSYPDQSDAGVLPAGTQMALVAWHRLQTCDQVDLSVAFDFTSQFASPTWNGRAYLGEAPEAGAGV